MKQNIFVNLFISFVAFIIILCIFEIIMSFYYGYQTRNYGELPKSLFVNDEKMGYRLAYSYNQSFSGKYPHEYNFSIYIRNSWRDDLPDNISILVLGDSYVFGGGVEEKERFTELLEKRFNITLFNAGIIGYGTYDYNKVVDLLYPQLNKNAIVILGATLLNDVSDNSKEGLGWTTYDNELHLVPYNFFHLPKKFHLFITRVSRLYCYLVNSLYSIFLSESKEWEKNKNSLDNILTKVKRKDGTLIILFVYHNPRMIQLTKLEEVRSQYHHYCFDRPEVLCIDPYSSFIEDYSLYFANDVHWTKKGHEAAASSLSPFFEKRFNRTES